MKLTVKLDFGCGREIKVGTFSEIGRDTAFEFAGEFLSSGLDPAPFRLRAGGGLKIYDRSGNMETFGLFDDSLPDGWGRRIVDRMFMKREGRLPTVTERLMCVGRSGKGALVYEPADEVAQAANEAFDLAALAEEAMAFDAGEAEDALQRLRKAGGSSGGARPKAYVGYKPFVWRGKSRAGHSWRARFGCCGESLLQVVRFSCMILKAASSTRQVTKVMTGAFRGHGRVHGVGEMRRRFASSRRSRCQKCRFAPLPR